MCLRCPPTLPLLKDHLLWFLSPCEDDGDFQNLVWFFFHWSKFRFIMEGLSGFLILTEMVSHQMPSPRSTARPSGHGANTVHVEHSSIFQRFIILALAVPLPVCTNKNKTDFWCKCSRACTATAACVWPGLSSCFLLQLWGHGASAEAAALAAHDGLSLSCHHLGSHQGWQPLCPILSCFPF